MKAGDHCACFPSLIVLGCFIALSCAFIYVIFERNTNRLFDFAVYVVLAGLFLYNFLAVMLKDAGSVTKEVLAQMDPVSASPKLIRIETKRDGSLRFCRTCNIPKPDRTHHCHNCKRCHMRMDHHCAFVNNCVAYRNHKHFVHFLWWGALTCLFVAFTSYHGFIFYRPVRNVFLHSMSLGCFMAASIFSLVFLIFFGFQMFLILRGYTVIEFVEKRKRPQPNGKPFVNRFHVGIWKNMCQVLGDRPLLWFLPVYPPILIDSAIRDQDSLLLPTTSVLSDADDSSTVSQSSSEARHRAKLPVC